MIDKIVKQLYDSKDVTVYDVNKLRLSDNTYLCTLNFKQSDNKYNPNQYKLVFPDSYNSSKKK